MKKKKHYTLKSKETSGNFQVFDRSHPDVRVKFIALGFQVSETLDCVKHHIKLLKWLFKPKLRPNLKK